MGFKTGLMVGLGAGYVLGAKAGRQRYDDIRQAVATLSGSPKVQQMAGKAKDLAGDRAKESLRLVQKGVEKAGSAVKDRLGKDEVEGSQPAPTATQK